jgi:hypothetical protein
MPAVEARPAVQQMPAAQAAPAVTAPAVAEAAAPVAVTPAVETAPAEQPAAEATSQLESSPDEAPEPTVPLGRTFPDQETADAAAVEAARQAAAMPESAAAAASVAETETAPAEEFAAAAQPADETIERMPPTDSPVGTIRLGQPEIGFSTNAGRAESTDGFETLPVAPLPDLTGRPTRPTSLPSQLEPLPALDSAGISGK